MTAYGVGWDLVFGEKEPTQMIRNPYALRRNLMITYEIPIDFRIADWKRFTRHLLTMCDDWDPENSITIEILPKTPCSK